MNNYLTHLLTRSWNQAEVVQPRPLSLFEPLPMMGKTAVPPTPVWDMLEETTFTDAPRPANIPAPAQPLPKPSLKNQPSTSPQVEAASESHPIQPKRDPVLQPKPQQLDLSLETAVPAPEPPSISTPKRHAPPPDLAVQPTEPPIAHLNQATALQSPSAEPLTKPTLPVLAQPILPLPQGTEQQSHLQPMPIEPSPAKRLETLLEIRQETVRERIIERPFISQHSDVQSQPSSTPTTAEPPVSPIQQIAPPEKTKTITAVQPQQRPFLPVQTHLPTQPPPEPPTINVTIGRIEVRATPSSSSPIRKERPQSSKAPKMGLDEYLKQRNGGQP